MVVGLTPQEASDRLTIFQVLLILRHNLILTTSELTPKGSEKESQ